MTNPRAIGLCSLFPTNPNIYSTETYRLRVLTTTWQWGCPGVGGKGYPQVQCFRRWRRKKPKLRTGSGVSTKECLSPFFVHLTPQILNPWGPVCDEERLGLGATLSLGTSVVQGAQVIQRALSSVLPYICAYSPQRVARRGWRGSHPQGQLGGR